MPARTPTAISSASSSSLARRVFAHFADRLKATIADCGADVRPKFAGIDSQGIRRLLRKVETAAARGREQVMHRPDRFVSDEPALPSAPTACRARSQELTSNTVFV